VLVAPRGWYVDRIRILAIVVVGGLFGTFYGANQCIEGYTYSVAARQEASIAGRVTGISVAKGGEKEYHYVFSVNGVKMNDYSNVCATPLAPGACFDKGPVLVYYSYQPFSNSRLEDFAVSSAKDYRSGKPALAIALPLFLLSCTSMVILARKGTDEDNAGTADQRDRDS
jgi:hypothetical protein